MRFATNKTISHASRFALVLVVATGRTDAHALTRSTTPSATVTSTATLAFDHSHKQWSDVLAAHVSGDRVAYAKLKAGRTKLDQYVKSMQAVTADEYKGWKRDERCAFWINAYNAFTVQRVVDAYPIESMKDLGNLVTSVWDQKSVALGKLRPDVGGDKLSLNEIQNKILRDTFKDARVHAALCSAATSSPEIVQEAFTAARLDAQLDARAQAWLAGAARNKFDRAASKVQVSKVFDWYKEDFVRDAGSVQGWLAKHAPESERAWIASAKPLKIDFLEYAWKLNDAK
ncbi:MAG: DUF547 domain-containing protein [Planctomycetota bacterium]